jgi:SAM-dependent methyltransferase
VRVLDVGGTQSFWDQMDPDDQLGFELVLLNIEPQTVDRPRTRAVVGDAADLSRFGDGEFDVVLSNSVIEHLPAPDLQARMAAEIRRVGRRHFLQTPNRYFPLEPHFLFPFFQFLPVTLRTMLLRRFALGWYPRQPDRRAARDIATSIRLVSHGELKRWFPGATIVRERVFLLTKSFVVLGR